MALKPIPDGYHTATPYLIVDDGAAAIDFYRKAFGATELFRLGAPGGKVGHAGIFEDPFGHQWHLHTHVEDVPPEELERRAAEMAKGGG